MKTIAKIAGTMLILILAGNMSLSAQHGMRGMDNYGMYRMTMGSDTIHRHGMGPGMRGHMGPGPGFGKGMVPFDQEGLGPVGPGRMILESVPNVTENQKKEIAELLKKHQADITKIREEMSAKIQAVREANRKNLYNILTDEQKKYIDSKRGKTSSTSAGNTTATPSNKK